MARIESAPVTPATRVRGLLRDRLCADSFLALQHWRLCMYLSWLPRPRKWRCRLTDFEYDVKEPLRTTCSLAVTTLSIPISECDVFHVGGGKCLKRPLFLGRPSQYFRDSTNFLLVQNSRRQLLRNMKSRALHVTVLHFEEVDSKGGGGKMTICLITLGPDQSSSDHVVMVM